jgi:hypothetical protein
VVQVLRAQGCNPCEHCGRFGHQPAMCWMLPQNAHLRQPYWRGVNQAPETTNRRGHNILTAGNNWRAHGNAQEGKNMVLLGHMPDMKIWQQPGQAPDNNVNNGANRHLECGNMSIDNENKECEWLLVVRQINTAKLDTINESLKDLGLSLNNPDVWIGDTRATTHNTAYIVNHRTATVQDNIVGVTGPLAKAKMIVDILCETNCNGKNSKFVLKDAAFVPES